MPRDTDGGPRPGVRSLPVGPLSAPVVREFLLGIGLFFRGFGTWFRNPRLMLLGAIPGFVVGLFFLAGVITLAIMSGSIAAWATPFAQEWDPFWRDALRVVVAVALVAASVAVAVLTFAAVTLAVAAPFTDRISRETDRRLGGAPEPVDEPVLRAVRRGIFDGLVLIGTGLLTGVIVFLVGLIPLVGGPIGWMLGGLLGGRALAIELTGTPGDARGIPLADRQRMLAERRALALGFGVCAYVMFLIPGGAVVGTPAATAGGTLLMRELMGQPTTVLGSFGTGSSAGASYR